MEPYAGFEPRVGEIQAVRTFRVGAGGVLYPLFSPDPWRDGTNTARCRHADHDAPDPDCTCGFYAYGSVDAAGEYAHARDVLAVVSCWGRVVAGSRGVRAEHARIDALWLSPAVPSALRDQVGANYRASRTFADRRRMLQEHPPTGLDCYDRVPAAAARARLWLAVATAVLVGALPGAWLREVPDARALLWAACAVLGARAFVLARRPEADQASRRRSLLFAALVLWLMTPLTGPGGVVLRLPMLQVVGLGLLQRVSVRRTARRFPADVG